MASTTAHNPPLRSASRSHSARYAPSPERFGFGGIGFAFLVHGFLIAALTWGTSWRSETTITTAAAELWAALPVEAAPPLIEPSPALPPEPQPEPPAVKAPEIVVEKAKPEPPKKDTKKELAQRKEAEAEQVREQVRQDQIKRMAGLAGATGGVTSSAASTGTAQQSAAPSASYAGKVVAKIRPNIVFADADSLQGNPAAEVDIRIAPDGTIVQPIKISKSSGNKAWDAAVLRAIEKTDTLPRDVDGRIPSSMTLILRPKQ